MTRTIGKTTKLAGIPRLPSDKSVSHRAAILSALADGPTTITGYSDALDPQSTLAVLKQLGIRVSTEGQHLVIEGKGLAGFRQSKGPLDCGNSGTTMRLMAGVLAGQPYSSVLIGDASLSVRPMDRIASPLQMMGAHISMTQGHAPLHIGPTTGLSGMTYHLPVPSAQVKSCVLLAGLLANTPTTVVEAVPSRDHTERMMGLQVMEDGNERRIVVIPGHHLPVEPIEIPADFSAAVFFLVAGSIVSDSEIRLTNVGINPTRAALLDVLHEMGARISIQNERTSGREPVADLEVQSSHLHGIDINPALVPNLIDEFPALLVAAACAEGTTRVTGAAELRVKETDRISAMAANLKVLGADVAEFPDGLSVAGGKRLLGAAVSSYGDHRIAMAMGIAGLVAEGATTILDAEAASVSFTGFWDELDQLAIGNLP